MKKLLPWAAGLATLVVIFGTIYGVAQQVQRNDANYPQIQLAEDAAAALNGGAKPAALTSPGRVNLAASLAPFLIIYDRSGQPVAGTGYLAGRLPRLPYGVLTSARGLSYNYVTWQPRADLRFAIVSVAANNYYVASGRSLTEVEKNETKTFQLSMVGGVVSAAIVVTAFLLSRRR